MEKSNLPQAQISFTPTNDLIIQYPKKTIFQRFIAPENKGGAVIMVGSFLVSLVLFGLGSYGEWATIILAVGISQIQFLFRKEGLQQISFTPKGLAFGYENNKTEKYNFEDSSYVDFKVKIIDDSVELDIDKHLIHFDGVENLPIILDYLAKTWNMEYYDTIDIDNQHQVLTYFSKDIPDFEAESLIQIDEDAQEIQFIDKLGSHKFIKIEKASGKVVSYKFSKAVRSYIQLNNNDTIKFTVLTNIGISKACEIQIEIITNEKINTIFISEERYEDETVKTYRDVEMMCKKIKSISILNAINVEKVFK